MERLMSKSTILKKRVIYSLVTTVMAAASQGGFAHTRLESPTILEGSSGVLAHNRVTIGHGCPPITARNPSYGTSVVFPNAISYSPIIGVDGSSAGKGTAKQYATNQDASTYYAPLAGIGALIREGGAFPYENIKADAKGNIDGFWAAGKSYDQTISTPIQVSFKTAAVTIAPASCARSVTFVLAIADICTVKPSATATDAEILYWSPIPNFTGVPGQPFGAPVADTVRSIPAGPAFSLYDGYADAAHTIAGDGWGSPATLKVVRNTTGTPATLTTAAVAANPLPAGCAGNGGLGDDVYIYPSAAQINAELPIWTGTQQTGTNYWK